MSRFLGWHVHGWAWPIVWWARRKPRSDFRQWLWERADAIQWRHTLRYWRRLQRMSDAEFAAYVRKRYSA